MKPWSIAQKINVYSQKVTVTTPVSSFGYDIGPNTNRPRHRQAGLKFLQPAPLCLGLWAKLVLLSPDRGGSLKRFHRPNLFKDWLHKFQGKTRGLEVYSRFHPVCLQSGPYEASEGIYPGHGQRKSGRQASENH